MDMRVPAVALVVLILGSVAATTVVGGNGPSLDRTTRPSNSADARTAATESQTVFRDATVTSSAVDPSDGETGTRAVSTDGPTMNISYTYRRLPAEQGAVEATLQIPATPGVDRASIEFQPESTVVEADGVVRNGSRYEWTGNETADSTNRPGDRDERSGRRVEPWVRRKPDDGARRLRGLSPRGR